MVEKAEGAALGQRDQPDGKLGQFDRQRIQIDAVEAAFGDEAAGDDGASLGVTRQRLDVGVGGHHAPVDADCVPLRLGQRPCLH